MIGRGAELGRIRALLDAARAGRCGSLLVSGDPGVGKSTILAAAADLAGERFTVLRTRGVESEAGLDHAALLAVLAPVRGLLPDLPARPAAAVAAAVGWGAEVVTGDRYLVGAGTMMLIAQAAETRPVLVLVDDLQWLDRESAEALLFAARRLSADAAAFLFAVRGGVGIPAVADGVDRMVLAGLAAADAAALLPGVAPPVAERVRAAANGNPLAMLAAAERLSPAQRTGTAALPQPLPVGERLERDYARLLAGLTPAARQAVLLLAASHDEAEAPVVDALRAAGFDAAAALDEALEHGAVAAEAGRLTFRHPLLRSAAWSSASAAQRREAHRALAAALPRGANRALHAAAAAAGRDEKIAAELASLADTMRARRGLAAASAVLERAAALTGDAERAAGWLAEATEDAFLAGDSERVKVLGGRALDSPAARARIAHTLGLVEEFGGTVARAAELQEQAARDATGLLRARALHALVGIRHRLGDTPGMLADARRLAEVADETDPEQRMLAAYCLGAAETVGGDAQAGREMVLRARDLLESEPDLRDDPRHLITSILVARWVGDPAVAAGYLWRRLDAARERGALGPLAAANAVAAAGLMTLGDHAGAYAMAGEAAELGERIGYRAELAAAHVMLAFGEACRGRHDAAAAAIAAAHRLVASAGLADVAEFVHETEAFCAACRGDHARAVAILEPLASTATPGWRGDALAVAPELVGAYLAVGRPSDAADLARRYLEANPPPLPPAAAALVARTAALTEPDLDLASASFEEACARFGPDVFEVARTRLMHGARLRRAGQRVNARAHLRAAHAAFTALDLALWAGRAADELAATGETGRQRKLLPDEPLTSQEMRVAQLVARGMTNKEVAAALFLSPKTVEHHLGNVFRKRGVRSRTELAHAFASQA
jgi:DNA-binding CsgD family transcriptional regulator